MSAPYVVNPGDAAWGWTDVEAEDVTCQRCGVNRLRRTRTRIPGLSEERLVDTHGQMHHCHDTYTSRVLHKDAVEGPHAWIQWKGTNVCMDVYCACGEYGHVDANFAYFYRCPSCQTVWAMGATVRLHALTPEEQARILKDCDGSVATDNGEDDA